MRKGFILAAGLMWIMAAVQFISGGEKPEEEKVVEVFQSTMTSEHESMIEAYGLYEKEYLEVAARESLIKELAGELGVEEYEVDHEYQEGKSVTYLEKENGKAKVMLSFYTVQDEIKEQEMEKRQYLGIEICLYESLESVLQYRNRVENIFSSLKIETDTFLDLKGSYEGKLEMANMNAITDLVLEDLDGVVVTENRDEELFTVYAYTKYLKKYRGNSYENANINIAFHYNEKEDKTEIYLATPVIRSDY